MRVTSLPGKLIQLSRARPSLWRPFVVGWLHRQQIGYVPCAIAGCDKLLKVPAADFYESYRYFCEDPAGRRELDFFSAHLRPAEVMYDIGAFRGAYSAATKLKLKENAIICAFEPIARNAESIRRICALNGFENFTLTQTAVAEGNSLVGRVNERDVMLRLGDSGASTAETEFPAVSIDQYIADGAPVPSVMKIDVDGFELPVLRGARECLGKRHPRLWLEVHPVFLRAQGRSDQDVLNFVRELGYAATFFEDRSEPGADGSYHIWCE